MKNLLIADAGSTKVEWVLIGSDGNVLANATSDGLNALLALPAEVEENFSGIHKQFSGLAYPDEIHYYGAGCATPAICDKMSDAIKHIWGVEKVSVSSDLLGAARALFGRNKGIACILGTGSNSCLYNGKEIEQNVPSLGYILGDEGSGAALGKRLVREAFKGILPEEVRNTFLNQSQLTLEDILEKVYRGKAPNKFLASLVPFIKENIWNTYLYSLVLEELTLFFKRNVALYSGAHPYPVGFIGSIAANFENILREAASSQGYSVGKIMTSPIEGLIEYHKTADDE